MTTSEIHIKLGVLLQKVNTHKSKNFLPQELDMLFNFMLDSYKSKKIDLVSNPKQVSIFDTQTTLDNLSDLFETVTLYPSRIEQGEASILLPLNFYGWINARATITYECPGAYSVQTDGISYLEYALYNLKDINLTDITSFVYNLSYKVGEIIKTVPVFDYAALPLDYLPQDGVKDYKRSFIFINAMLKLINKALIKINEESNDKIYVKYDNKREALVLFSTNFLVCTVATNLPSYEPVQKIKLVDKLLANKALTSPITISDTEYEAFINASHLSKSRAQELRATRTREVVKVVVPESVRLSSITLTYLRQPQYIDYLLTISSDLPDDIINKIIADTAQFTKGIIASDTYEKFTRENTLIE